MTRKQAEAFVSRWSRILCPEYDIELVDGPDPNQPANEHAAACYADGDYLRARIFLHDALVIDDDEARKTLIHELLHLTLNELEVAGEAPVSVLGAEAGILVRRNFTRALERTVDRLAVAFAEAST